MIMSTLLYPDDIAGIKVEGRKSLELTTATATATATGEGKRQEKGDKGIALGLATERMRHEDGFTGAATTTAPALLGGTRV